MYNLHYLILLTLFLISACADNENTTGKTLPGPGDAAPGSSSSTVPLPPGPYLFFVGDGVYALPAREPGFTPVFVGGGGGGAYVSYAGDYLADSKSYINLRPKKAIWVSSAVASAFSKDGAVVSADANELASGAQQVSNYVFKFAFGPYKSYPEFCSARLQYADWTDAAASIYTLAVVDGAGSGGCSNAPFAKYLAVGTSATEPALSMPAWPQPQPIRNSATGAIEFIVTTGAKQCVADARFNCLYDLITDINMVGKVVANVAPIAEGYLLLLRDAAQLKMVRFDSSRNTLSEPVFTAPLEASPSVDFTSAHDGEHVFFALQSGADMNVFKLPLNSTTWTDLMPIATEINPVWTTFDPSLATANAVYYTSVFNDGTSITRITKVIKKGSDTPVVYTPPVDEGVLEIGKHLPDTLDVGKPTQEQFLVSATLAQSGGTTAGATVTSVNTATQEILILGQLDEDIVSVSPYATIGPYAIFTGYLDKEQSMGDLFYVDAGTGASLRRITRSADLERPFKTLPFDMAL